MNGNLLALGAVGALAFGTAARRGSRSALPPRTVQFADLVSNFRVLLEDLMEERWGSDDGEPISPPDVLPVTLRAVEPLYRQVEHDFWDDRGPAHVAGMVRTMGRRVPGSLRRDPDAVADRLLARVAWLAFRGTGKPRKRISCLWMAPVVTFGGVVADGRHRLFAAHQLGITHLPSIEMDDLGPAGSRTILGDLPLYHGTRHDFTVFQLGHPGRKDNGWLGRGVYLTDSPDLAESYARIKRGPASPRVMEVRAHLQNPYYVDDVTDPGLKRKVEEKGERATLAMTAELRRLGHDGVILNLPERDGAREIVVLDPGRIQHVRTRVLPPVRNKRGSASVSLDPRVLGKRLRTAVMENAAFQILDADPELVGSDWGQGGCAVLASALVEVLGPGAELRAMVHDGHVQHYVVTYGGLLFDGDGAATLATFRRRWLRDYGVSWARTGRDARDCRLVSVPRVQAATRGASGVVTFDGACPVSVVAALVAHLRPRLFPSG